MIETLNNIETMKVLLWLSGGLIMLFIGAIAFFLRQIVTAVEILKEAVTVLKTQQEEQYPVIVRRLNAHASRLDKHQEEIAIIKTTCSINHR